uniref:C2H2-type domain-containing protein n=1 Tax=Gasterosteus aculeatus aculeatus TaxID=481459 RepID=A0AAQ4PPL1_GASAC
MADSHQVFHDARSVLQMVGPRCIFCTLQVEASVEHLHRKHLRDAVYFQDGDTEKCVVSCYCQDTNQRHRCHNHCPFCNYRVFSRTASFRKHLQQLHGIESYKKREKPDKKADAEKADDVPHPKDSLKNTHNIPCMLCSASLSSHSNLRRHIRDLHNRPTIPIMCIDPDNGIYVTPRHDASRLIPIHVIKSTSAPNIDCEVSLCRKLMDVATASGNPGKECVHLERVKHADPYVPPESVKKNSLQEMLDKGLISTEWSERCEELHTAAASRGTDSVNPIFYGLAGFSKRWLFFSIFTDKKDNWCRFERTMVSFDSVAGQWHCPCREMGRSHRCVHRMMAMWWIFQECPNVLSNCDTQPDDIEDMECELLDPEPPCASCNVNDQRVLVMTEYLAKSKRIPALHNISVELRTKEKPPPTCFIPSERNCPYCPGPTAPALLEETITTQATVYGYTYIEKGVSVAVSKCPVCGNHVRFQDYASGFHNFNNRVFLTLPLCALLLSALANKTACGRMLDTINLFNKNTYHHQTVRQAFHHFLSLMDFEFKFSCHQCGHNPPVIIADANWKVAFDVPVGTFKRPDLNTVTDTDLNIDIEKTWADLDKEMIAEGFTSGTTTVNPYRSLLSYSTLAPWMGKDTRAGNILPKTEVKKGLKKRSGETMVSNQKVDEDLIHALLESKKPQKKELQDACAALGVTSEGSISDLINRLEELLNFKELYPKLFVKLQKTGGGLLHFSCTHGVVYYVNFLFWGESARDHVDGLLSFNSFPTVYISDVAGQVSRHMNNRTQQKFFQPHDGRLCAPSQSNISAAAEKKLEVDLEWINNLRSPGAPLKAAPGADRFTALHSITKTNERYSLYDRFHQKNQRRPEEKLRSLNICPALRTEVNSSVAEQLNHELGAFRYSLCRMKEAHFKQAVRVLIELHNENVNNRFLQKMLAISSTPLAVGQHGRLVLDSPVKKTAAGPHLEPKSAMDQRRVFSAQKYSIDDTDKEKLRTLLTGSRDERQVLNNIKQRHPLCIRDVCSVCPVALLGGAARVMPWLTDDLAMDNSKSAALSHFDFILWHRDWINNKNVNDRLVSLLPDAELILLPRLVGHINKETGNHFILWVLDFSKKEVRIYDSLKTRTGLDEDDLDLLKNVFREKGGLRGWSVTYPVQWLQKDSVNCGIFVCSVSKSQSFCVQQCLKNMKGV